VTALLLAVLRLVGRLHIAVADEIDRALSAYRVEVPSTVPAWMDKECDL
jgi:hypothetical protein